jgi:hypothetical protein
MEAYYINSLDGLFAALADKPKPGMITNEMVEQMTPEVVLEMAKSAIAGAHNGVADLRSVNPDDGAAVNHAEVSITARQEQSKLWLELYDRLLIGEQHAEFQAEMDRLEGVAKARKDGAVAATPEVD